MYILYFDGMLTTREQGWSQTGLMGYGWLLTRGGVERAHGFGLYVCVGNANSSLAEYFALTEALEAISALSLYQEVVEIRSDARSVIDQMTGYASVGTRPIREVRLRALSLASGFSHLRWTWVPRRENASADRLSRRGLRQMIVRPWEELADNKRTIWNRGGLQLLPLMDITLYQSR
jgi:ribonuclease HI